MWGYCQNVSYERAQITRPNTHVIVIIVFNNNQLLVVDKLHGSYKKIKVKPITGLTYINPVSNYNTRFPCLSLLHTFGIQDI